MTQVIVETQESPKKTCSRCGHKGPLDDFNKQSNRKDGRHSHCKSCTAESGKEYYRENKEDQKAKIMANRAIRVKKNLAIVGQYFVIHPCVDCGESDPIVLEFDHRNPQEKLNTVMEMVFNGSSLARIMQEIEKCDIRCYNCHRRKTAVDGGWWRTKITTEEEV